MKSIENNFNNDVLKSSLNTSDSIYALGSAYGKAGVSLFRVSGLKDIVLSVVEKMTDVNVEKILTKPRHLFFTNLYNPVDRTLIDSVLISYFKAPNSFTGEDVLEIHTHGSIAVIKAVLNALSCIDGLRLAERGEFTKRAFFNGKMDLLQVEGLADLIEAKTEAARKQAVRQMGGAFTDALNVMRDDLLKASSLIEAQIDFLDDDFNSVDENATSDEIQHHVVLLIDNILNKAQNLLNNNSGFLIRAGISVAVIGKPNVGKSSLFNLIVGEDRSIISSVAGTTRDVVDASVDIDGVLVEFADTAGLHETSDEIESEGINRALKMLQNADVKIAVFDCSDLSDDFGFDKNVIDENTIIVFNKIDLLEDNSNLNLIDFLKKNNVSFNPDNVCYLSVKSGYGFDLFMNKLKSVIKNKTDVSDDVVITQERHKIALENIVSYLKSALLVSDKRVSDLQAENIKLACNEIGKLTGKIYFNELLDNIFSGFCIGK